MRSDKPTAGPAGGRARFSLLPTPFTPTPEIQSFKTTNPGDANAPKTPRFASPKITASGELLFHERVTAHDLMCARPPRFASLRLHPRLSGPRRVRLVWPFPPAGM